MDIERLKEAISILDSLIDNEDDGLAHALLEVRDCIVCILNLPPACPECGDLAVIVEASPDWHMPRDARCDSCGWIGDDTDLE